MEIIIPQGERVELMIDVSGMKVEDIAYTLDLLIQAITVDTQGVKDFMGISFDTDTPQGGKAQRLFNSFAGLQRTDGQSWEYIALFEGRKDKTIIPSTRCKRLMMGATTDELFEDTAGK